MRVAPAEILTARLRAVAADLETHQLEALVVTHLPNIAYLTGFFASAAAAVVASENITLIGDGRYRDGLEERGQEFPRLQPWLLPSGSSYDAAIVEVLTACHAGRVGFEAAHLTVSRYNSVAADLNRRGHDTVLIATDGVVEAHRACKDAWEIGVFREAAGRLSDVAKCILPKALAGRAESEVAADIELELRRAGFERPAFDTIVASGPNAARPHARAGQRRIEAGDLVVLDFGGVLDGYCTDITRTVTAGPPRARERRLIEQVIEAQAAAFAAVRPGGAPEAVDRAARETLSRHGVGEAFSHGTGHGLGLEIHEAPRISPPRPSQIEPPLAAGMVLTLEPGAYFPGWGGARIEDDVLVTTDGAEWLTDVPRFLHEDA
jgi:Xaa-Pro aminopeptidase